MNDVTAGDLARQVRLAREEIAEIESGNGWQARMPQVIGALEHRLQMLCDAIDYMLAGTR